MLLNYNIEKNVSNIYSPLFSIVRQFMMKFCSYMYILLSLHQSTTDMIAHYMYIHITLLLCNLIHVYLQNFISMKILLTTTNTSRIHYKRKKFLLYITIVSIFNYRLNLKETSPKELVCEVYEETGANESQLDEPKENPTQR